MIQFEAMAVRFDQAKIIGLSDQELIKLRHGIEREVRRRGLRLSVGDLGERLVVSHYTDTPGLSGLQSAPPGTKNVDALSRNGERYSIKTVLNAKKTGTVYPDRDFPDKQLFEYLVIAALNEDWTLKSIHQFSWDQFLAVRRWDRRMSAWYIPFSSKALGSATKVL
jgi:hypothetical protein